MDTVLLAVTVLSLAMAMAMAFIVVKLMREERARSEARVNALTAMAVGPAATAPVVPSQGAAETLVAMRPARVVAPPAHVEHVAVENAPSVDDLDLRPAAESVAGVSHLFEEAVAPSPWGRRFTVIGTLAAAVIAIAFVLASTRSSVTASRPAGAAAQQQPAVLDSAPLELVALRHTQEAERLVITGLVQNPRGGARMSHVVATAFLFGPDGAFLTSNRAPLDFTTLSPGDESPFVVNVPVTGQVARYRIGFRTEDGRVIEHVDKRGPDALAQK
jgi:uncharacterized protein (UPF0333 family)